MRDAHLARDLRPHRDEPVHPPVAQPDDPQGDGDARETEHEHHHIRDAEREEGERRKEVDDDRRPDVVGADRRIEVGRRIRVVPVEDLLRLRVDLVVEVGRERIVGEADGQHGREGENGKDSEDHVSGPTRRSASRRPEMGVTGAGAAPSGRSCLVRPAIATECYHAIGRFRPCWPRTRRPPARGPDRTPGSDRPVAGRRATRGKATEVSAMLMERIGLGSRRSESSRHAGGRARPGDGAVTHGRGSSGVSGRLRPTREPSQRVDELVEREERCVTAPRSSQSRRTAQAGPRVRSRSEPPPGRRRGRFRPSALVGGRGVRRVAAQPRLGAVGRRHTRAERPARPRRRASAPRFRRAVHGRALVPQRGRPLGGGRQPVLAARADVPGVPRRTCPAST